MGRYVRILHLITPEHDAEIRKIAARFGISANAIVRAALDIGLPILAKLPIDKRNIRGMMDTETNDNSDGE